MPTVYHRDQPGAPSYAFSTASGNAAHFNALKTILMACLVTGYGGQAAAGWELIAEGDQFLVLRNGTHSGYVCFTRPSTSSAYVDIWLAETFTGMSGDYMTGVGLRSGTAAANSIPHRLYIGNLAYSSALSSWYVIADSATFVFQGSGGDTGFSGGGSNARLPLYVGEDSEGWFVAVGGQNTTGSSPTSLFGGSGFTALRNPSTGLLVDSAGIGVWIPALTLPGTASMALPYALREVSMGRVRWSGDSVEAGYLRGNAVSPQLLCVAIGDAANSLGLGATLNSRNINTPLDLGDSNTWFIGVHQYGSSTRFVTDAAGYW